MGAIQQALVGGHSGVLKSSGYFDATSNTYVYTAGSSDFDFGTGNFTIDFWVQFTAAPTNMGIVATQAGNAGNGWSIGVFGTTIYYQVTGVNILSASLGTVTLHQWYHFAFVRSGGVSKCYKNGVSIASSSDTSTTGGIYQLSVGRFYGSLNDNYRLQGYLDELRISKGIARWTSNFTVPSTEYTADSYDKLLLHFTGSDGATTFTDSSLSPKTVTASGNAIISTTQGVF